MWQPWFLSKFKGAGYIAVELAGILNAFGSQTTVVTRAESILRTFDPAVVSHLTAAMTASKAREEKAS